MRIGKCTQCKETRAIVPVLNPKGLCSKCWQMDREQEDSINESKILNIKDFIDKHNKDKES